MHALVTAIAKYLIIVPVLLAIYIWLRLERRLKIEFLSIIVPAAIITVIIAKIGGKLYYDPRPFIAGHFTPYFTHGNDNGFPSDHTLFGTLLAYMCLRYNRTIGIVALICALLVGIARVIAGVHHGVDVIGAALFSLVGFGLAQLLVRAWVRRSPKATDSQKS